MTTWTRIILLAFGLFLLQQYTFAQPAGFIDQVFAGPFEQAVGLTFDDNGRMYIYEKGGKVWVSENGEVLPTPLLDISEEVGNWRDFGMLGFTLDPNFLSNGYFYCLYIVDRHHLLYFGTPDYNPNTDEYFNATIGRITRFQADVNTNFTTLVPNSRYVLLGENITNDGFPNLHQSHGTGSLLFGTDGTLLASFGDGASYSSVDQGSASETYWQQAIDDGIISSSQNVGAYRSQLLNNLAGKLIRIDPMTGNGIPSNPYYQTTNPSSARSKVFARGLRNPCRMTMKPETGSHDPADADPGVIYIGDVGWGTREELNVVDGPGLNFGWPKYEGMTHTPGYNNNTYQPSSHELAKLDWRGNTARGYVNGNIVNAGSAQFPGPNFTGNCSIGGVWYNGDDFPAEWKGTYFHADYGGDWIKNFRFDENNNPLEVSNFISNTNAVVFVATSPFDGGIYYIGGASGGNPQVNNSVHRISFTGGNLPPLAIASSNIQYGTSPLTVDFKGDLSYDPNNDAISFNWNFGDGSTSTEANPSHTFTTGGSQPTAYTATLTVADGELSDQETITISLNNTPPQINSTSVDNVNTFSHVSATTLNLNASVSDAEHSDSQLTYEWFTELHHNNHFHAEPGDNNPSTSTTLSPVGCDGATYFYRVILRVTDPAGLFSEYKKDIYPDCSGQNQTITMANIPDKFLGAEDFSVSATASSGLPVIYHIIEGPATISGNIITLSGTPGVVTVRAIQSGNNQYAPAIPHERIFTVQVSCTSSQSNWSLLSVNSEELNATSGQGAATLAFDGNASTFWHTEWVNQDPVHPHDIRIDLGSEQNISGFKYLPRQDGSLNGTIGDYEFYTRVPGGTWGSPKASGTFAANSNEKIISFNTTTARFIRLRALSEINGNPWTSAAEINVITECETPPANQTINFPALADKLTTDGPFSISASATSGLPVNFTILSGPASLNGNTITLDGTSGIVEVEANQFGNEDYNPAAPVSRSFLVGDPNAGGLTGNYYNNLDFTNPAFTRVDPTIDFQWGTGSPDPSMDANTFSIIWDGGILPFYSEVYTFTTITDDGVRLWVNDQLIIDQWILQAPTAHTGSIALTAGQQVSIRMEFFENQGGAVAELRWSSNSQNSEIIPESVLFPTFDTPDTNPPTVSLSTNSTNVEGPFTVNVSFSEPITGLTLGDFNGSNANLTNLNGSGQSYSLTVNPINDGQVSINLPANRVQDAAGNSNTASNTINVNYTEPNIDTTPPSVSLSTASSTVDGNFEVAVEFNETINGLTVSDFQITNGTANNDLSNVGLTYYFTVDPQNEGTVTVLLPANRVQDNAGNNNTASNSLSVNYSTSNNNGCTSPTNIALGKLTEQSSDYSGGAESELAVDGNTSGNWWVDFSVSSTSWGSNPWWEVDLGSISEIQSIRIFNRTDCCQDFLSNYYILVSDAPFSTNNLNQLLSQSSVQNFFQEAIAGTPSEINLNTNGRYVRIQKQGSGFMALAEVEIIGCEDSNNPPTPDTTPPSVSLSTNNTNVSAAFSVDVDFDENVSGLTTSDFNINNGTATTLSGNGSGYTLSILPVNEGIVSIQLPANRAQDAAGNGNNASNTLEVNFAPPGNGDCNNPENVALGKPTKHSTDYNGGGAGSELAVDGNTSGNWWVDFSVSSTSWGVQPYWEIDLETSYSLEYINIYNRTDCCQEFLSDYYILVSDVPFSSDNLNTVLNQSGVTSYFQTEIAGSPTPINLGGTGRYLRIQSAGNGFVTLAEVEIIGCIGGDPNDTTPPTVSLSSSVSTTDGNFGVNVEFSEPIIGLTTSDFQVTNGTATGLNGSGDTYALMIIPEQAGTVSVRLPSNRVTDQAGNGNTASNQLSVTYDPPPIPTLTITSPSEGSVISASDVTINYQAAGDLASYDAFHLLLTLDDNPPIDVHDISTGGSYTFTNLSVGSHTVLAQLANTAHIPLDFPASQDQVSFTIIDNNVGNCTTLENLALNGTASQSSEYNGGGAEADLAIDGNTSGNWYADFSVASTSWQVQPWWEVDLGAVYNIEQINVWNRTDCCADFLGNYYVLVSDTPFNDGDLTDIISQNGVANYHETTIAGTPSDVTIGRTGRYVRVMSNSAGFMALAELEVMGCPVAVQQPILVQSQNKTALEASLYPNPANENIVIKYDTQKAGKLRYIIANNLGVIYQEESKEVEIGEGKIIVHVKQWPASAYTVYLQLEGYRFVTIPFIRIRD